MADTTNKKTDEALAKLESKPPALKQTTFLVTVDHHDGEEDAVRKHLATAFGNAQKYEPATTPTLTGQGRTHDNYGNPYDKSKAFRSDRDAYGNPYNRDPNAPTQATPEAAPKGRDAYGNPY